MAGLGYAMGGAARGLVAGMEMARRARADAMREQMEQDQHALQLRAQERLEQDAAFRRQKDAEGQEHTQRMDRLRSAREDRQLEHDRYAQLRDDWPEARRLSSQYPEAGARPYVNLYDVGNERLARDPEATIARGDVPGDIDPRNEFNGAPSIMWDDQGNQHPAMAGAPGAARVGAPTAELGPASPDQPYWQEQEPLSPIRRAAITRGDELFGKAKLAQEQRQADLHARVAGAKRQRDYEAEQKNRFLLSAQNQIQRDEADLQKLQMGMVQIGGPGGEWKYIAELTATPEQRKALNDQAARQRAQIHARRATLDRQLQTAGMPQTGMDPLDYVESRAAQGATHDQIAAELREQGFNAVADTLAAGPPGKR